MSYVNYDGYMIEKDPLAPKSLFDNGGGGGGGGGDLPSGTTGQILVNNNGTWEATDPPFITTENADAKYATDGDITTAVNAEKEAREAADASINETIASQATLISNNTTLIGTETSNRQSSDKALDDKITAEVTARTEENTALDGKITQEKTDREAAITALSKTVQDNYTELSDEQFTLTDRISDTQSQLSDVQSQIETINSNVTANTQAISNEETARAQADTALGRRIDDEASARSTKDTEIDNNLSNLQAAVNAIKGVPKGGTEGQFLRVDATGNPVWETLPDADTTKY